MTTAEKIKEYLEEEDIREAQEYQDDISPTDLLDAEMSAKGINYRDLDAVGKYLEEKERMM